VSESGFPGAARLPPPEGTDASLAAGAGPRGRSFEAHRDDLRRYIARSLGLDRALAEDLVQDTFVRALAAAERLAPGDDPRPWLFRIATNLVIDHHRAARLRRRGEEDPDMVDPGPSPETMAIREDMRSRIRAAIARLPEEQREVFLLREYGEVPFKEIASRMGAPIGTVLARMHYAMLRIRKEVEWEGEGKGNRS
jgi:RNA polymerase sigma-70 factor (ECF subfamily)